MFGFHLTCGNQLVVVLHHIDQLNRCNVVGFQAQRVDDDLDHLVAIAGNAGLQHRVQRLNLVLQILGDTGHGAFRHRASQVDDHNGEFRKVDFRQRVGLGPVRELRLCPCHGIAHIRHHGGFVPAKVELQRHTRVVFRRGGTHLIEPVEIGQLGFHDFDQQAFGIFG